MHEFSNQEPLNISGLVLTLTLQSFWAVGTQNWTITFGTSPRRSDTTTEPSITRLSFCYIWLWGFEIKMGFGPVSGVLRPLWPILGNGKKWKWTISPVLILNLGFKELLIPTELTGISGNGVWDKTGRINRQVPHLTWKHRKNCECCPVSLLIVR